MLRKDRVPPLGIRPKFVFDEEKKEQRLDELKEAIKRFLNANYPLPTNLMQEYNDITENLPIE